MKLSNFASDYSDILAGGPATGAATYVSTHEAGTASMHVASAVTIADAGNYYVGATVEAALQELGTASTPTLAVYDESSLIGTPTVMKFTGDAITATYSGGTATVAVTAGTASALDDLTDVTITTAALGEVLTFNGSIWLNDALPAFAAELLVEDGASNPPVTLTNEAGDDWLYADPS